MARGAARRPLAFDAARYPARNVIERSVGCLKQWRAVAMRCGQRALNYRAVVAIAALMPWIGTAR